MDESIQSTSQHLFDTTKTILGDTIDASEESTRRYLELLGVTELDKQFNAAVQAYNTQFKLQAEQMFVETNVASLAAANLMADNSKSLGTGAVVVQGENFNQAVAAQGETLQSQLAQSQAEVIESITKSYESALTTVLGKQDAQGNFENILKYQENSQLALDALLKKLASDMNGNEDIFKNLAGETPEGYNYESYLLERGYLNYTATPGEYEITDLAIHEFDKMLNSPLEPGQAAQLLEDLAANMAASEYGTRWESMTPNAQAKAVAEYKEWFYDNQMGLYHTTFGLSEYDENGNIVLDTIYEAPSTGEIANMFGVEVTDTYISAKNASPTDFGDYLGSGKGGKQDSHAQQIIDNANNGMYEDGAIVSFNYGKGTKDYWVYYDGGFYKTNYSDKNKPPVLTAESVSADFPEVAGALRAGKFDNGTEIIGFIYYNGKLYNKDSHFYENGKLYSITGKFKEYSGLESAKESIMYFGKFIFTSPELWKMFKAENRTIKQALGDAFGNFLDAGEKFIHSSQTYNEELARYNAQLRKNAKEVR